MRTFAKAAQRRLLRYDCLTTETIVALASGTLSPAERATAEAHVQQCARCAEEVQFAMEAEATPEPLLEWTAPTLMQHLTTGVRRLVARLIENLPNVTEPALTLRGVPVGERPQIFEAEDVTLSITSEQTRNGMILAGVLSDNAPSEQVQDDLAVRLVIPEADSVAEDRVEQGAFEIGPVPAGTYNLEVTLPDRVIVIEGLELRA